MYHSNNPRVIELPDDIDRIESLSYVPGDVPRVTVTFVLKDTKRFESPNALYATNGVEHRLFTPQMTLTEVIATQPVDDTAQQEDTPQIELQPRETPLADTLPRKTKKKASDGGGEA